MPIRTNNRSRATQEEIAPGIPLRAALEEAANRGLRVEGIDFQKQAETYAKYKGDPARFGEEVLGNRYTPDILEVFASVLKNPVTIAKSGNQVGKTYAAADLAWWFLLSFPGSQVFTIAAPPEDNLKLLLWGHIGDRVLKHPEIGRGYDVSLASLHIQNQSDALSFITGIAIPSQGSEHERKARFSGKHAPYLLFIADEGDAIPDYVYEAIESCMSGAYARLLIMFNPRAEMGPVYIKERNKTGHVVTMSAFTHPNVVQGTEVIPGAVDRHTTVRRVLEWSRPLMEGEPFDAECYEVPSFLVGEYSQRQDGAIIGPVPPGPRKVTENPFNHMVLARYPAQSETQLISTAWLDAARKRWDDWVKEYGEIPPICVPVLGQDVGELGQDSSCTCIRYDSYVAPLEGWKGVDPLVTALRCARVAQRVGGKRIMVDGTGVGSSVAPHLEDRDLLAAKDPALGELRLEAHRVMVAGKAEAWCEFGQFALMRDQLWWAMREWLRKEEHEAKLPPDNDLLEELRSATYTVESGKIKICAKKVMREVIKRSPDRADALALTFFGSTADIRTSPPVTEFLPKSSRADVEADKNAAYDPEGRIIRFFDPLRDRRTVRR